LEVKLHHPRGKIKRGQSEIKHIAVLALCADGFEPQARRYTSFHGYVLAPFVHELLYLLQLLVKGSPGQLLLHSCIFPCPRELPQLRLGMNFAAGFGTAFAA
jgi:hypothetical protein